MREPLWASPVRLPVRLSAWAPVPARGPELEQEQENAAVVVDPETSVKVADGGEEKGDPTDLKLRLKNVHTYRKL